MPGQSKLPDLENICGENQSQNLTVPPRAQYGKESQRRELAHEVIGNLFRGRARIRRALRRPGRLNQANQEVFHDADAILNQALLEELEAPPQEFPDGGRGRPLANSPPVGRARIMAQLVEMGRQMRMAGRGHGAPIQH
ncbi:uncharacterized protein LOC112468840, partial [Temnothorax curvispinosus]|uniref:Uncharacterized protein LOC112468840 n=1 Tax=Temnothorax curvispinosus TaxID=300111 RepID=A0A6J1RMP7_9HYME